MTRTLTLATLLLTTQANAQLRAEFKSQTPPGQATMRVYDGGTLLWEASSEGLRCVRKTEFSPDKHWLLTTADGCGYIQLWDVQKGERRATFLAPLHQYRLNVATFTPDSRRVLLSFLGDGKSITKPADFNGFTSFLLESSLWDIASLERVAIMSRPERESAYHGAVHFSANGERMVFTDAFDESFSPASVWEVESGRYVSTLTRLPKPGFSADRGGSGVKTARLSPDGRRVLVFDVDGRLAEYDADTVRVLNVRGIFDEPDTQKLLETFARTGK